MVYFCAFARSEIFQKSARKVNAGVNGLTDSQPGHVFSMLVKILVYLSLNVLINKNRGAVVNRALEKRGLSAKRDSPTLQQIYEKRSI